MAEWLLKYVSPKPSTRDVRKKCVYKVPDWLKDGVSDTMVYTPEIISFGPYHWGTPGVEDMENHKARCVTKILNREGLSDQTSEIDFTMRYILPEVRACYDKWVVPREEDPSEMMELISDDDFVKMIVFDGCFMLEYLRMLVYGLSALGYELDDPVFSKKTIMEVIGRDMIKAENQLAIIVPQTLLAIEYKGSRPVGLDFPIMVLKALSPIWVSSEVLPEQQSNERMETVANSIKDQMLHCLDIFRSNLLFELTPDSITPEIVVAIGNHTRVEDTRDNSPRLLGCIPLQPSLNTDNRRNNEHLPTSLYQKRRIKSVEDLRAAGVHFKIRNRRPFWDIKFDNRQGVLQIPPIQINNTSKTIFLNLIAYEHCHLNSSKEMVITDYLAFMDTLINTGTDVGHLHKAGIIAHQLGNEDEVADIFNNLVKNAYVISEDGWLKDTYTKLNEYCDIMRHLWFADLRHNYVKSPWVVISIFAAFILFLLTFIQTGYAIIAYHKPPN